MRGRRRNFWLHLDLRLIGFVQVILGDVRLLPRWNIPGKGLQPHRGKLGIGAGVDDFGGGVFIDGMVQLVLHDFEEQFASCGVLAVVLAGCEKIQRWR